jgi:hypothetical protein
MLLGSLELALIAGWRIQLKSSLIGDTQIRVSAGSGGALPEGWCPPQGELSSVRKTG